MRRFLVLVTVLALTSQAAANGSNAFLGSLLVTDCP